MTHLLLWGFLATQIGASIAILAQPDNAQFWESWRQSMREAFVVVGVAFLLIKTQALAGKDTR